MNVFIRFNVMPFILVWFVQMVDAVVPMILFSLGTAVLKVVKSLRCETNTEYVSRVLFIVATL